MNNSEIVSLRCPSCGNETTLSRREFSFGLEFTCESCKTTGVIIAHNTLYVPQLGEHICVKCGKVGRPTANYCQCGAALKCECVKCLMEIPATSAVCDQCGWPQDIDPESEQAREFYKTRSLQDLFSRQERKRNEAIAFFAKQHFEEAEVAETLSKFLLKNISSKNALLLWLACRAIANCGEVAKVATSELVNLASNHPDPDVKAEAIKALGRIGKDSLPLLIQLIDSSHFDIISKSGNSCTHAVLDVERQALCDTLLGIGTEAVPALIRIFLENCPDNFFGTDWTDYVEDGTAQDDNGTFIPSFSSLKGSKYHVAREILGAFKEKSIPALKHIVSQATFFSSKTTKIQAKQAKSLLDLINEFIRTGESMHDVSWKYKDADNAIEAFLNGVNRFN